MSASAAQDRAASSSGSSSSPSSPPPLHCYCVWYEGTQCELVSRGESLSELRRLFNSGAGSGSGTSNRSIPCSDRTPVPIPDDDSIRASLNWNGEKWVELLDGFSLRDALNDQYFMRPAVERKDERGVKIEILFQSDDSPFPTINSLTGALNASTFISLASSTAASSSSATSCSSIPASTSADLRQRLQFLVYDLLNLRDEAATRLEWDAMQDYSDLSATEQKEVGSYAGLYLSSFYFSRDEQRLLALFPTPTGDTFRELVQRTVGAKFSEESSMHSSTSAHICSSHDLAPLYRRVFGLEERAFWKEKNFKKMQEKFCQQWMKDIEKERKKKEKEEEKERSTSAFTASNPPSSAASPSPSPSISSSTVSASRPSVDSQADIAVAIDAAGFPQLSKLRCLQAEQAEIVASGSKPDIKIAKQIVRLEKEVKRMQNSNKNKS